MNTPSICIQSIPMEYSPGVHPITSCLQPQSMHSIHTQIIPSRHTPECIALENTSTTYTKNTPPDCTTPAHTHEVYPKTYTPQSIPKGLSTECDPTVFSPWFHLQTVSDVYSWGISQKLSEEYSPECNILEYNPIECPPTVYLQRVYHAYPWSKTQRNHKMILWKAGDKEIKKKKYYRTLLPQERNTKYPAQVFI